MTTWNRPEDTMEHGEIEPEDEGPATAADIFGYCPSGDDIIVPQHRDEERRSPELDADEPRPTEPPPGFEPEEEPIPDTSNIPDIPF